MKALISPRLLSPTAWNCFGQPSCRQADLNSGTSNLWVCRENSAKCNLEPPQTDAEMEFVGLEKKFKLSEGQEAMTHSYMPEWLRWVLFLDWTIYKSGASVSKVLPAKPVCQLTQLQHKMQLVSVTERAVCVIWMWQEVRETGNCMPQRSLCFHRL